ncbi:MAG: NADH-quinone oxidoreductase subunit NuoK [Chloroflexi bacterium]|nr:NADH-quinone oxidoreductase subunit NuoK [Chloroflexota bacterium]
MSVGLNHFLVLSAVLFSIGMYGVLAKRNVVVILMCVEIMLNAVIIALVAFSRFVTPTLLTGQVFAIFVITIAAAEAAVGLALLISIYRNRENVDVEEIDLLKM